MNFFGTASGSPDQLRVVLIALIFALALTFDSAVIGATPLLLAGGLLLVGAGLWLPDRTGSVFALYPVQALFSALVGLLLVVLYQTSLSQDLSFIPSWVLIASLLVYWLLLGSNSATRILLWWLLVAMGAVVASYSCWQFLTEGVRVSKPINDPNNYASQLYLLWIPSVHLLLAQRWAGRMVTAPVAAVAVVGTVLAALTMFATESRAGMLIMLVALACWWGLALSRRAPLRDLLVHTLLVLGVFALCTLMMGTAGVAPGGDNTLSGGMAVRFGLMGEAWQLYLERPLGGVGLGVFAAFYAARRPLWDQVTAGRFVHNDYLQFLLEGGPLLLIALLCIGCWAMYLLRRALQAPVEHSNFAHGGFALAACALFGHAHINFVFYLFTLPMLLAVVLAAAQSPIEQTAGAHSDTASAAGSGPDTGGQLGAGLSRLPQRWLWLPLLLGWVAWGYLAIDVVTGGVISGKQGVPFIASLKSSPQTIRSYARLAQTLNDDRGLPFLADAALSAQQAADSKNDDEFAYALRTYRRAIEVDPWNTNAYMALYNLFRAQPALLRVARPDEYPDELLQRALSLNRQYLPALDALLELFANNPERRNDVLRAFVAPWLELIAHEDVSRAQGYLRQMDTLIEPAEYARLEVLLQALSQKQERSGKRGADSSL